MDETHGMAWKVQPFKASSCHSRGLIVGTLLGELGLSHNIPMSCVTFHIARSTQTHRLELYQIDTLRKQTNQVKLWVHNIRAISLIMFVCTSQPKYVLNTHLSFPIPYPYESNVCSSIA